MTVRLPASASQRAVLAADAAHLAHVSFGVRLAGELDESALAGALDGLVARHESLRTRFETAGDGWEQVVSEPVPMPCRKVDLLRLEPSLRESSLERVLEEQVRRPFDLAGGLPVRSCLVRIGEAERALLLTAHGVAVDERSLAILAADLSLLYGELRLAPPPQYRAVVEWQRSRLAERRDRQLSYWGERLRGAPPMLTLPADRVRPAQPTFRAGAAAFDVPADVAGALEEIEDRDHLQAGASIVAAFAILLARHARQAEVVVGVEPGARLPHELDAAVGPATGLLPLRIDCGGNATFVEFAHRVAAIVAEAAEHGDVAFEHLVAELGVESAAGLHPLCQSAVSLAVPPARAVALDGLDVSALRVPTSSRLDLRLSAFRDGDRLTCELVYSEDIFARATIDGLARRFRALLGNVARGSLTPLSRIEVLPRAEREQIVVGWNRTSAPYPAVAGAHALFEARAAETPDAPAIADAAGELTYAEVDAAANRLAHHLLRHGVRRESIVGVSLARSREVIVAFLAILKAGATYLPLDPTYPRDRLEYIVEHAGVVALVTQAAFADRIPLREAVRIVVDADPASIAAEPASRPDVPVAPESLAYAIYTSGSTGRPKGVEIPHRGLSNLGHALREMFHLAREDRVALFSSLNFDASVWEMALALMNGSCLCIVETAERAATEIADELRNFAVTVGTFPPSFLRAVASDAVPSLRLVISAGEACSPELVRTWGIGREFVNAYGPTEATVCATYARCDSSVAETPPIGRPLPNVQAYVLDPELNAVPQGVAGELHVGGAGLARCYRGSAVGTAAAFVPDPFGPPGSRIYRTGDLVRHLPDGSLQYLERIDDQVKVRGFRIELREIEETLMRHPDVRDAAVAALPVGGDTQLAAYVVLEPSARAIATRFSDSGGEAALRTELRGFLERMLPPYMLPSLFTTLDSLPLSPSGKIDRDALPDPSLVAALEVEALSEPQTATEETVAEIWMEHLGLGRLGREDSFFEIGGHSLVAAQVIADVREQFGVQIAVRTLFEYPVVAEFAAAVDSARDGQTVAAG